MNTERNTQKSNIGDELRKASLEAQSSGLSNEARKNLDNTNLQEALRHMKYEAWFNEHLPHIKKAARAGSCVYKVHIHSDEQNPELMTNYLSEKHNIAFEIMKLRPCVGCFCDYGCDCLSSCWSVIIRWD